MKVFKMPRNNPVKVFTMKRWAILFAIILLFPMGTAMAQTDQISNEVDCEKLEPMIYNMGLDLDTIGEIDRKTGSYELMFWLTIVSDEIDFTKCPPPSTWDFTNGYAISRSGMNTDPHFHKVEVHGVFFEEFDFRDYPFEKMDLSVHLESYYPITADNVKFQVNDEYSGISTVTVQVPGWEIRNPSFETSLVTVPWGIFPHFEANFTLETLPVTVFLKKILPVLILAGFGFSTFFMSSHILQNRIAIIGTAMVGSIFFHAVILLGELPPLGYLTIADKIMISVYSVFAMCILGILLHQRHLDILDKTEKKYNINLELKLDKKMIILTPIIAIGIFAVLYPL